MAEEQTRTPEERTFWDHVKAVANWIGENVMPDLYAKARQGAKEFEQILPAFPDSVRTIDEPGTFGCPTQLTVNLQNGTYDEWQESKQRELSSPQAAHAVATPAPERQAEMEL